MIVSEIRTFNSKCNASSTAVNVAVHLSNDISKLHPFLNATMEKTRYMPKVPFIRFIWEGHVVNVEGSRINAFGFESESEARAQADRIVAAIKRVESQLDSIVPDHTEYSFPPLLEIYRHLPRISGCSLCGHPSCMAFASAVSRGECEVEQCVPLQDGEHSDNLKALSIIK